MGAMEERSAAGEAPGRPAPRDGSLFLYNLWAWPFLATHTLGSYALAVVPPPVRFVARRGILGLPVAGAVLRRGGHILVDREPTPSNEEALARAALLARRGDRISFFPEGTRSRTGRVGPFRSGAFRVAAEAGTPVVPLVLAGTEAAFDSLWSPIRRSDVAVRFLPSRAVSPAEANDSAWREALRGEMAAAASEIAPGTGPRL